MKKDLTFLKGMKIAHRGLFNNKDIIENTIEAFKKATEKKMAIELDLQLLKDNTIIVFHDDSLKRLTGVDKNVIDCTWDEIKNLPLLDTDARIPTIEDVLNLVNGKVLLDIELKENPRYKEFIKLLMPLLDDYHKKGMFLLKSFDLRYIRFLRKKGVTYPLGLLGGFSISNPFLKTSSFALLTVKMAKPDFVAYGKKGIQDSHLQKLRKKMPLLVWAIRSDEVNTYKEYADAFIIEDKK